MRTFAVLATLLGAGLLSGCRHMGAAPFYSNAASYCSGPTTAADQGYSSALPAANDILPASSNGNLLPHFDELLDHDR